jgi:hypothetical protein
LPFDQAPILPGQDIATAILRPTVARIGLVVLGFIAVIVTQLFAFLNVAGRHNPYGAPGIFYFTVRITGMIDIAGKVLGTLAVQRVMLMSSKM